MPDSHSLGIPEIANTDDWETSYPLVVKKGRYDKSFSADLGYFPDHSQSPEPADMTRPDRGVKVYFYVGSPSDRIGKNGDFYLEEETNVLYGPKINGVWPEEGVPVTGPLMRKRFREAQEPWAVDLDEIRRDSRRNHEFARAIVRALAGPLATLISRARNLLIRRKEEPGSIRALAAAVSSTRWNNFQK